jgi:hypothetical protein
MRQRQIKSSKQPTKLSMSYLFIVLPKMHVTIRAKAKLGLRRLTGASKKKRALRDVTNQMASTTSGQT